MRSSTFFARALTGFTLPLTVFVLPLRAQQPDAAASDALLVGPQLRNPSHLADELTEQYPLWLRNAAIGGTARVALRVDAEGKVDSTWIAYSTGLFGLDRAALATVRAAEYEPATRNGAPIPFWTELPLTFRTGDERDPVPAPIELLNRTELASTVQTMSPESLREEGVGARVGFDIMVDGDGRPRQITIVETSCFPAADARASEVVSRFSFAPSSSSGFRRTYAFVRFGQDTVSLRLLGDADPPQPDSVDVDAEGGRRPELRNRRTIARALEAMYPPDLRQMGLGGETLVWFRIDEEGDVVFREVNAPSGNCDLDLAALAVGERMRFRPAVHPDGHEIAVWVAIPIVFSSR